MTKQYITIEISKQEYINKLQSIRNMSIYDICRPDPAYLMFYVGKPHKKLRSIKKFFWCSDIVIFTTYKWRLYRNGVFLFSGDNLPDEKYNDLWDRMKDLFQSVRLTFLYEIKVAPDTQEVELLFNDGYKLVVEQEGGEDEPIKLLDAHFYHSFEVYKKNNKFYSCKQIKKRGW